MWVVKTRKRKRRRRIISHKCSRRRFRVYIVFVV
jgi:hypothetical protein